MSLALDDLPRDHERRRLQLQHMTEVVAAERSRSAALEIERDTVLAERDAAQAEIEKLRLLIRRLQRGQFGRRSERLDPDQLQLGLEDLEQTAAAAEAAREEAAARSGTPRTPRVRRRNLGALPAHLPRVEVLVDLEDKSCPCCGGALHAIGEDREEMLDIIPAQLRVRVIRRPRYGCRACEEAVVQAPAPERPVTGGMATEALLAHVLVAKFCDHLPLYRQAQIFARQGIELDRSTLSDWVGRACWWLEPLWRLLRLHVWLTAQLARVSGKSGLAEAIRYALRHWPGLVLFLEDGRLELDTNTVERAIRPISLGRKNSLFAGSDGGGGPLGV